MVCQEQLEISAEMLINHIILVWFMKNISNWTKNINNQTVRVKMECIEFYYLVFWNPDL